MVFGHAPLGLPPSVAPEGRTSDAPLSALINNTPDFRAPDGPLLRSTMLELYYNVEAIWLIYQRLSALEMVRTTSRGKARAVLNYRNILNSLLTHLYSKLANLRSLRGAGVPLLCSQYILRPLFLASRGARLLVFRAVSSSPKRTQPAEDLLNRAAACLPRRLM